MSDPLRIAVVGHTNTGKTSLLRTLLREPSFGEVSQRPATTRHVQRATLALDGATLELFDTPGLERSIELLEHLEALAAERHVQGIDRIERFLESPAAEREFAQEAKVLRQLMHSDVGLYVVDVREPMMARHRDELTALSWCARPVVPVLNFVKSPAPDADPERWREGLRRVGLHTMAEFDAVVRDLTSESQLLSKIASVVDEHAEALETVIAVRRREHEQLLDTAARLIAELLIDAAAHHVRARHDDGDEQRAAMARLQRDVCQREQRCAHRLLEAFGFDASSYASDTLSFEHGRWGIDLFSAEAAKHFGAWAGGGAATGAAVGLVVDVATAGLTLGTGTAIGAAAGAALGAGKAHGRRLAGWWRGHTELRCDDATLKLLAARQIALVRELLQRGHAALRPIETTIPDALPGLDPLPRPLRTARAHPLWSSIASDRAADHPLRADAVRELAAVVRAILASRA